MNNTAIGPSVFDKLAQEYDEWFDTHMAAYQSELEAIRRFIPRHGLGVEIGIGTGRFASHFGITLGVEPSEAMAALARSRGITVHRPEAEMLPFGKETFDFVLLINVLCFVRDRLRSIREVHRILKPQGRIILAIIDREIELGRMYESLKSSNKFYSQATFFSGQEVIALLRRVAFNHLQSCQTIFSDPDTMTVPEPVRDGYGEGAFVVLSAFKD